MRSILFPKPTGFKFYEDSLKFIMALFFIAIIGNFTFLIFGFVLTASFKMILAYKIGMCYGIIVPLSQGVILCSEYL